MNGGEISLDTPTNYRAWFAEIIFLASHTELTSSLTAPRRDAISSESLSITSDNRYPIKSFLGKNASHA
jgi:hypothetical protein